MRAISMVSNSSHNFQPSGAASVAAISAAPLPYSRSIVMILIIESLASQLTGLTHSHPATGLGIILANDEGEQKHYARRDGQHPENIDVSECLYLSSHSSVKQTVGPLGRVGNADAGVHQTQAQSFDLVLNRPIEPSGMLRQHHLVNLRAPRQQRRDHRGSYAAADIAHEVDDAGYAIGLFGGHPDIASHGYGNKQKAEAYGLNQTQHGSRLKTD